MIFNITNTKKLPSMTYLLSECYGGIWKNIPFRKEWYEESGNGSVWVSCSVDEYENITGSQIHYYNNGSEFLGFNVYDAKLYLMCKIEKNKKLSFN